MSDLDKEQNQLDRLWQGDLSPSVQRVNSGLQRGLQQMEEPKVVGGGKTGVHQVDRQGDDS